jgi:beta-glucanase (GH16 family)
MQSQPKSLALIRALALTMTFCTGFVVAAAEPTINADFGDSKSVRGWEAQSHVFHCNETQFNPRNIVQDETAGTVGLKISDTAFGDRQFSGSELKYVGNQETPNQPVQTEFLYGRYSASIKIPRFPGSVSSLFLYRSSPWQEIDIEFLDSNPRKIQFNVYFNKGKEGDNNNDYRQHSPAQMDLPFDASEDFHEYTIEWAPGVIRWFVDGKLYREILESEKVPYLPMTLRMNHWGVCKAASGWSGAEFATNRLQKGETPTVEYQWIRVWQGNTPLVD